MRTRVLVLRAVFIGLAMISAIFWLVWMFDINANTKFQILWGSIDLTMIRRLLAGVCVLGICGVVMTLHFSRKRFCLIAIAAIAVIFGAGLLISIFTAPDMKYYTFQDQNRELIVMEETRGERRQATFYERKNPAIIEYLGNMDYYADESAFTSGNYDISWQENGQVIVKVRAQFQNRVAGEESYVETRETKEQIFYVEEK